MTKTDVEVHHGIMYTTRPIVCEQHMDHLTAKPSRVTVGGGMWNERGLICPICYRPARYATDEEAEAYQKICIKDNRKP